MKKVIALILCLIIAAPVGYIGFALPKKIVGKSDLFSASEIKAAMKTAKKQVKDSGDILKFLKIKYSEKKSEEISADYGNADRENTIVILIDFATKIKANSFKPLDIYQNYYVILKREDKNSPWTVLAEQSYEEQKISNDLIENLA